MSPVMLPSSPRTSCWARPSVRTDWLADRPALASLPDGETKIVAAVAACAPVTTGHAATPRTAATEAKSTRGRPRFIDSRLPYRPPPVKRFIRSLSEDEPRDRVQDVRVERALDVPEQRERPARVAEERAQRPAELGADEAEQQDPDVQQGHAVG